MSTRTLIAIMYALASISCLSVELFVCSLWQYPAKPTVPTSKPSFQRSASVESFQLPFDEAGQPKRSAAGVVMGQRSPRAIQLIASSPDLPREESATANNTNTGSKRTNLGTLSNSQSSSQALSPRSRQEAEFKRDLTGTSSAPPLSPRVPNHATAPGRKVCRPIHFV
jgi:hypothetical protein